MLLTTLLTIMILLSCTSTLPTSTATAHSTVSAIYDAKDGSVTNGTVISQQCLAALLVIGGVEQNPGPLKEGDAEKENILASLVINTDDDAIKSVLRIYEVGMTTKDLKKKLSVPEKEKLVKTMDFLGVPDQESYTKPAVVHNLICRIQNLFPDKCAICNTLYATQLGETPLLECASCGQGAHTDCITKCLGITTEELPTFTTEKAKEMMNPHNIPGVHYFCGECTENIVPSRDSGRLKRARAHTTTIDEPTEEVFAPEDVQQKNPLCQDLQNKGPNSQEDPTTQVHRDETSSIQDLPNHDTHNQVPENQHPTNQAPLHRTPAGQDPSRQYQSNQVPASQVTPDHDPSNQEPQNHDRPICKFYRKGTCRHGISGKGCPNRHPPACKALIQHGKRGPRGCTNGNKCKEFHPKMCQQSLKARECLTLDCPSRHVAGTKRTTSKRTNFTGEVKGKSRGDKLMTDFLEAALQELEIRLMEAMDSKMKTLHNPPTAPAATTSSAPLAPPANLNTTTIPTNLAPRSKRCNIWTPGWYQWFLRWHLHWEQYTWCVAQWCTDDILSLQYKGSKTSIYPF